jgi:hypothetical protein
MHFPSPNQGWMTEVTRSMARLLQIAGLAVAPIFIQALPSPASADQILAVEIVTVEKRPAQITYELTGTIEATHSVPVSFRNGGRIVTLVVDVGSTVSYFPAMERGRGPFKGGAERGLSERLYSWSKLKGLSFQTDTQRWAFAYALARKINKEGTRLFKQGGRTDIYTPVVSSIKRTLFSSE